MANAPDQSVRIKPELMPEESRAPPPTLFYFDGPTQPVQPVQPVQASQAVPPPLAGGLSNLFSYDVDRLLQESRDLVSSGATAAGPSTTAAPPRASGLLGQGEPKAIEANQGRNSNGFDTKLLKNSYETAWPVAPRYNRDIAIPVNGTGSQSRPGNEANMQLSRTNVFEPASWSDSGRGQETPSRNDARAPPTRNGNSGNSGGTESTAIGQTLVSLNNKAQGKVQKLLHVISHRDAS